MVVTQTVSLRLSFQFQSSLLEIPAASLVSAITIEFDRVSCAFTGSATVLPVVRRAPANRILTSLFIIVIVCHDSS